MSSLVKLRPFLHIDIPVTDNKYMFCCKRLQSTFILWMLVTQTLQKVALRLHPTMHSF